MLMSMCVTNILVNIYCLGRITVDYWCKLVDVDGVVAGADGRILIICINEIEAKVIDPSLRVQHLTERNRVALQYEFIRACGQDELCPYKENRMSYS